MMIGNHRGRSQAGAVLLLAIVILTVLLVLGGMLVETAQTGLARANAAGRSARSFQLAEAGVDRALWELSRPDGWRSYAGEASPRVGGGYFDVAVSPGPATRTPGSELRVTATGSLSRTGTGKRYPKTVQVVVSRQKQLPFDYAVAASQWVDVGNAGVDSYRSENGPYGPGNVFANADVVTNTTVYEAGVSGIAIGSNGLVKGDLFVGAGAASPPLGVNLAGSLQGTVQSLDAAIAFDPVVIPAGATSLGAISLSGSEEVVLEAGTYWATSLSISGTSAALRVTGDVKLYVDGNISVTGNGIVNDDPGRPGNLVIYGTDKCTSASIKGSATFYGAVYAPNALVVLQGSTSSGEIYGAVAGKYVRLDGSSTVLHYDESLTHAAEAALSMRSWQEL